MDGYHPPLRTERVLRLHSAWGRVGVSLELAPIRDSIRRKPNSTMDSHRCWTGAMRASENYEQANFRESLEFSEVRYPPASYAQPTVAAYHACDGLAL